MHVSDEFVDGKLQLTIHRDPSINWRFWVRRS